MNTDVITWILRGDAAVSSAFKQIVSDAGGRICGTPVQSAAIYAGISEKEEVKVERFFSSLHFTIIDEKAGKPAGEFIKQYGKPHNVMIADALVAACSRINNLKLWTMNRKHYPMLQEGEFLAATAVVEAK